MADHSEDVESHAAVDTIIEEFGGDPCAAVRALLYDIDALARDFSANVSLGFVRQEKTIWLRTIGGRKVRNTQ